MKNRNSYQVTVGNVGVVYLGPSQAIAGETFSEYVEQSKLNYGRAAGESVTLWHDGEPVREHTGHCPHI